MNVTGLAHAISVELGRWPYRPDQPAFPMLTNWMFACYYKSWSDLRQIGLD